jgi:hypothetical protein
VLLPYSENHNVDKSLHLATKCEIMLLCLNTMYTFHVVAVQAIFLKLDERVLHSLKPSGYCMYRQV